MAAQELQPSPAPAPEAAPVGPSSRLACLIRRHGLLVLATVAGAALGATYSLTIGCVTGGCPITSNPWLTGGLGALLGYSLVRDFVRPKTADPRCAAEGREVSGQGTP